MTTSFSCQRASRSYANARFILRGFWSPRRLQDGPRRLQNAPRRAKMLPRCPQDAPRRAQVAARRAQDGSRRAQKAPRRLKTPPKTPIRSIFDGFLVDFWSFLSAKLAPKWDQKSILALKRKNQLNISPLMPNWVRRVQVGSKNQPKIDPKTEAKREPS